MREIKFRAWDKKENRMSEGFYLNEILGMTEDGIESSMGGYILTSDRTLLQYTGLKDKNGKDVFEGDVVLLPDSEITPITDDGRGPEEPMNHLAPVEFEKGCFGLKVLEDSGTFHKGFWSFDSIFNGEGYKTQDLEIIGNIYEHSELTTPKQ